MLVLALEFSRGCTAHAWAGHHRWPNETTSEDTARPGHARGEWSPPAQRAGRAPGLEELPEGLDSETWRKTPPADRPEGHHRDRPMGSLPQNEIVRVRQHP